MTTNGAESGGGQPPAAAWYPDPDHPGRLRWWDGTRWADPTPAGSVAAQPPGAGSGPAPEPGARNTPALVSLILGIVSILINPLFLVGVAAIVLGVIGLRRASALPGGLGRGKAIAGIITGAVGTIVGVLVTIALVTVLTHLPTSTPVAGEPTSSAGPSAATPAPTPSAAEPPADTAACWDGSAASAGCPPLEGAAALQYVFGVSDGGTCGPYALDQFTPEGALDILQCSWTDLPGTEVYFVRYSAVGEAQTAWRDYLTTQSTFTEDPWLDGQGQTSGITWTAEQTDAPASVEAAYSYDAAPFVLDVWTNLEAGTRDDHSAAIGRLTALSRDDLSQVLASIP